MRNVRNRLWNIEQIHSTSEGNRISKVFPSSKYLYHLNPNFATINFRKTTFRWKPSTSLPYRVRAHRIIESRYEREHVREHVNQYGIILVRHSIQAAWVSTASFRAYPVSVESHTVHDTSPPICCLPRVNKYTTVVAHEVKVTK